MILVDEKNKIFWLFLSVFFLLQSVSIEKKKF